jgi:hypothetical protein
LAVYDLTAGDEAPRALTLYFQTKLAGLFTIKFSAMDSWFEEDEQVLVHSEDPYKVPARFWGGFWALTQAHSSELMSCVPQSMFASRLTACKLLKPGCHICYLKQAFRCVTISCRLDLLEQSHHKSRCPYKVSPRCMCLLEVCLQTGIKGEACAYDVHLSKGRIFRSIATLTRHSKLP